MPEGSEQHMPLMDVVKIRRAGIQDSEPLARIQVDSYRTSYAAIFPRPYLDHFTYVEQEQDWRDLLSSGSEDMIYVAETGAGELVGYALGRSGPSEIPPYDGELVALHVRQPYQGGGLGRRLIGVVAEELQRRGSTALMLWVLERNQARALYEALGGRFIGEKDWGGNEAFGAQVKEVAYGWPDLVVLTGPGGE
jgi:GNAT superfamily N-acetyltransferase